MQNLCDSQRIMLVDDVVTELGHLPKSLFDLHAIAYKRIESSGQAAVLWQRERLNGCFTRIARFKSMNSLQLCPWIPMATVVNCLPELY